jgi:hypothetical protein
MSVDDLMMRMARVLSIFQGNVTNNNHQEAVWKFPHMALKAHEEDSPHVLASGAKVE